MDPTTLKQTNQNNFLQMNGLQPLPNTAMPAPTIPNVSTAPAPTVAPAVQQTPEIKPIAADQLTQKQSLLTPPAQTPAEMKPLDMKSVLSNSKDFVSSFTSPQESGIQQVEQQMNDLGANLPSRSDMRTTLNDKYQVGGLTNLVDDLSGELNTLNAQYDNTKGSVSSVYGNSDALQSFVDGRTTAIQNKIASDIRLKAAYLETAQGRLSHAESLVDQAINDKFADIEAKSKTLTNQRQYLLDAAARGQIALSKAQEASLKVAERQQVIDDAKVAKSKEDEKIKQSFIAQAIQTAAKNGKPITGVILNKASNSATPNDALQILAPYMVDLEEKRNALADRELKYAQAENLRANAANTRETTRLTSGTDGKGTNIDPKYQPAVDIVLGSKNFTVAQKQSFVQAVKNGQDPVSVLKNQAKDIMGQTTATKVSAYEDARYQMQQIQKNLNEFYAAGGKTNLFKGNYESVVNKLGEVSDPKLVDLAVQIQSGLQIYRNAVSGTAYSVQEGADIASIFPGINNSQGLNTARLSGRMKAFDATIDGAYKSVLGDSYDALKTNQVAPNQPKATVQMIGPDGVQYFVPEAQVDAFTKAGGKKI